MDRIKLIERLSLALGPSGHEKAVARIMRAELLQIPALETTNDHLGSLICIKRGTEAGPKIMLAAHMDEVGFMVQNITKDGFLRILPLGGWVASTAIGSRVVVEGGHGLIEGVVASVPPHFLKDRNKTEEIKVEDLLMDIGALSEKEAREDMGIAEGHFITPSPYFTVLKDKTILGKAFDDRVGCALIVELMRGLSEISHPNSIYGVGTVQEEVGMRGARTAANFIKPDVAIILEGPPADDYPGVSRDKPQGALRGGAQIRCYDPSIIVNVPLKDLAIQVAEREGIKYQLAVRTSGATDAGPIHMSNIGVPCLVLSVPVRYPHAPFGILHMGDYEQVLRLLIKLIPELTEQVVKQFTL
ncbi:MAG: M42 family metallopeptidase [Candidatus Tectomicrobia bacterium]|uniref:M42 family metallopeptidase n=1 Tax=Tectimicrobiota bacterium TaxID=2528274 RepID=A0A933LQM3_UNCTE|nr:M42 family metallopeptidase [Candidatus Tectomicrobia bacterium]